VDTLPDESVISASWRYTPGAMLTVSAGDKGTVKRPFSPSVIVISPVVLVSSTPLPSGRNSGGTSMPATQGVNVRRLFTLVFGLGAALCAVAGGMLGPLLSVQVGMGESILILAFVVIVIGGIGSIRGALMGALLVGVVDTSGRTLVPMVLEGLFGPAVASNAGAAIASILIYVLMAMVLFWKPQGLFPAHG